MGAPLNGSENTAPRSVIAARGFDTATVRLAVSSELARDCLDASQIPYSGFVLFCPEAREQFYASRHHMVHRRYVGIRSFGADSVFG
jgi:hypothetical protein